MLAMLQTGFELPNVICELLRITLDRPKTDAFISLDAWSSSI